MTRKQIPACFAGWTAEQFRDLERSERAKAEALNAQHRNGAALHFTNAAAWRQYAEAAAHA